MQLRFKPVFGKTGLKRNCSLGFTQVLPPGHFYSSSKNSEMTDRSLSQGSKAKVVFLVGMPGCGKSTVGRALAEEVGYTFLDLDTLIEEQEGATVPQVFERKGQAYFREAEARALRQMTEEKRGVVLATGGGAPCFHGNMAFMLENGTAVYLQVQPQDLVARLTRQDLDARPLLRKKSPEALEAYLADTLAQRELFYAQAAFTVEAGGKTVAEVVAAVKQYLAGLW
jgi:shikimate kinase